MEFSYYHIWTINALFKQVLWCFFSLFRLSKIKILKKCIEYNCILDLKYLKWKLKKNNDFIFIWFASYLFIYTYINTKLSYELILVNEKYLLISWRQYVKVRFCTRLGMKISILFNYSIFRCMRQKSHTYQIQKT